MPRNESVVRVPRYCRHKGGNRAVVYVDRKEMYLGQYGTEQSLKLYSQFVEKWKAGEYVHRSPRLQGPDDVTVMELTALFLDWAKKNWPRPEKRLSVYAVSAKRLLRLHADTPVVEFGPLALQAVRKAMVDDGLTRSGINQAVDRIRAIWQWGVSQELVDESRWRALKSVRALRRGQLNVRESDPVGPARWKQLRAVLRRAPAIVRTMVRVEIYTGMRPGELVRLTPAELDRRRPIWVYRPAEHKTAHRQKIRVVQIGPRAQRLLLPLLEGLEPTRHVFRPTDAVAAWDAARAASVTGKRRCACRDPRHRLALARRKGTKPRVVGESYTVSVYRIALARACAQAYPPPPELARRPGESAAAWKARLGPVGRLQLDAWRADHHVHPHQLRHSFASHVNSRYDKVTAQILLGHSNPAVTELYIERDLRALRPVVEAVG